MSERTTPLQSRRLIPLTDWSKYHPYPPLGGLRDLVYHAKINGFDKVIRRVNRRILIDEEAWFAWVDEKNSKNMEGENV